MLLKKAVYLPGLLTATALLLLVYTELPSATMTTFLAAAPSPIPAQEGHPIVGTWYGDFGTSATQRTQVTAVLAWDGKAVTGILNPGPDKITLKASSLDSTKQWAVHFEGDAKNTACAMTHFVADGKMANIGSYNRTITGTFTFGTVKGDFKLKRD